MARGSIRNASFAGAVLTGALLAAAFGGGVQRGDHDAVVEPNQSATELGEQVSDSKWSEIVRRERLVSEVAPQIQRLVNVPTDESQWPRYGPDWAGAWVDDDLGRLVVAVTDSTLLDSDDLARLPLEPGDEIELREVDYSYEQLIVWHREIADQLRTEGVNFGVGVRVEQNVVEVEADQQVGPFEGVPNDAVWVRRASSDVVAIEEADSYSTVPSDNDQTFPLADIQPGMQIGIWTAGVGGRCTWGFNGHGATANWLLSAGHCFEGTVAAAPGTWQGRVNWYQNGSGTQVGNDVWAKAKHNLLVDAGGIISYRADTNCYYRASECDTHITSRQSIFNIATTQNMCASLARSGTYECGDILMFPFSNNLISDRIQVDMSVIDGDSGAGGKWNQTARGVLTHRSTTATLAYFSPIWYTVSQIKDLNCVQTGGWWATCPVV